MKAFRRIVAPAITFALLASCQTRIDTAAESRALLQVDRDFAATSLDKGAAEAFRLYLADDAMQLPANADPVVGRDAIYDGMKGDYELAWEPQKAEVSKAGDMGYTWGTYTLTLPGEGDNVVRYGKYVNVWRKQTDGAWKVLIDIGNQRATASE